MSYSNLIHGFHGDATTFYDFVVEEINKRNIPGLQYDWQQDWALVKKGGFLDIQLLEGLGREIEQARMLRAFDVCHQAFILGYQFADSFYVSVRTAWNDELGRMAREGEYLPPLTKVRLSCFGGIVTAAVKFAVERYLETSVDVPPPPPVEVPDA